MRIRTNYNTTEHLGVEYSENMEINGKKIWTPPNSRWTCAEDFYFQKNQSTSAGYEPSNLGFLDDHVTPRAARPINNL